MLLLDVVQTRVKAAIDALTSQLLQHVVVVRRHGVWYFLLCPSPLVLLFRTVRQLLILALLLHAQQEIQEVTINTAGVSHNQSLEQEEAQHTRVHGGSSIL